MLVVKCRVVELLITYLLMTINCMINDLGAGRFKLLQCCHLLVILAIATWVLVSILKPT